jgi:23S rRNA (uridine2552-2'-O)-methyltransferase
MSLHKKTKSSRQWLREHSTDPYVKLARKQNYRSRAAYKLLEIQDKDHIFKPGMTVIDLGAAPGGWSQVVQCYLGDGDKKKDPQEKNIQTKNGNVIAIDMLPMEPIPGVTFYQGDFTENDFYQEFLRLTDNRQISLVMSDLAPNTSGIRAVDQPRAMYMAELALDLAQKVLSSARESGNKSAKERPGDFLVKVFQGEGFDAFLADLRSVFTKVHIRKPKASRPRSREVYLLARGYTGLDVNGHG